MTKEEYQKRIDEYNNNPNICKQCGKSILCTNHDRLSDIKNKKFCNSSCAASFNNKGKVHNKCGMSKNFTHNRTCILNKYTDDQLISLYNQSVALHDFSLKLGYKGTIKTDRPQIKARFDNIGIDFSKINEHTHNESYHPNRKEKEAKVCSLCGKPICKDNKSGLCQDCYRKDRDNRKIEKWLKTGETGCKIGSHLRGCIRDYIQKKQNNRCAICGCENIWNGKELKFVLDHIDGDASNDKEENLRLVCPNCDSQLDTFKSKNKHSARNHRHKYYKLYKDVA